MTKLSRRNFISIVSSSAVVSASTIYSRDIFALSKKEKLGVALVGLGYYSRDLLAPSMQLTQHCELKGIVTGSPHKIPVWQKKYGIPDSNVYSYETMHQIANNPEIDVIYIVLPTGLHAKYSAIAANAGKHVWCEKPMAMTVAEAQSIINVCNKNKVKLSIGYRMQHEPNTRTVMSYAKTKPFGKINNLVAKAGYAGGDPGPDNWRVKRSMGGGALYDMGVYTLNAARYVTGEDPISVSARHEVKRTKIFTEVDESSYLTLHFPSGAIAKCATSVGQSMNILQANCTKGWYKLEPFQSYSGVRGLTSSGIQLNKRIADQQATQMDDDALAILNSTPVLVPGDEGLRDIHIIEGALKSAANKSAEVNL